MIRRFEVGMTRRARVPAILLCLALLALAGCRSKPLLTPAPVVSALGVEANRVAIIRGMALHRWALIEEEPGLIVAQQDKGGRHIAIVAIGYDDRMIEIRYRSSHGLRCQPQGESCSSIHRAYNRWVAQLRNDIEYGVQTVRIEGLRDRTAVGAEPPGAE
ncbi:MAG: hypothetical protein ACQGVC_15295 [Myxococcota bacterium]